MLSQLTRYASEFGVGIRRAELDVRITFDQRGKLMLGNYSSAAAVVSYRWDIEADALAAAVAEVFRWIERGCHTLSSLREPVPLVGRGVLNGIQVWESGGEASGGEEEETEI